MEEVVAAGRWRKGNGGPPLRSSGPPPAAIPSWVIGSDMGMRSGRTGSSRGWEEEGEGVELLLPLLRLLRRLRLLLLLSGPLRSSGFLPTPPPPPEVVDKSSGSRFRLPSS